MGVLACTSWSKSDAKILPARSFVLRASSPRSKFTRKPQVCNKAMLFFARKSRCRLILQMENDLQETVQLVGRDSLTEDQKLLMDTAEVLKVTYLQQNAYSDYDPYCPFHKSVALLNSIIGFYTQALHTMENSSEEKKLSWGELKSDMLKLWDELRILYQCNPKEMDEDTMNAFFKDFDDRVAAKFAEF